MDNYKVSQNYWSRINSSVDGMLGGFGRIHITDINGSRQFIHELKKKNFIVNFENALDCGAGIGRITKSLLLPLFMQVDMVDSDAHFLEHAKKYIGDKDWSKVGHCFIESLHTFSPESHKYDCIWIQWVIGYLQDEDFVNFLKRCKSSLNDGGCIIVKDNFTRSSKREFDSNDSSWTRTRIETVELFKSSGLEIIADKKQLHFPKELYEVWMYALKPI